MAKKDTISAGVEFVLDKQSLQKLISDIGKLNKEIASVPGAAADSSEELDGLIATLDQHTKSTKAVAESLREELEKLKSEYDGLIASAKESGEVTDEDRQRTIQLSAAIAELEKRTVKAEQATANSAKAMKAVLTKEQQQEIALRDLREAADEYRASLSGEGTLELSESLQNLSEKMQVVSDLGIENLDKDLAELIETMQQAAREGVGELDDALAHARGIQKFEQQLENLQAAGDFLTGLGQGILDPLSNLAQSYTEQIGHAESGSARLIRAQEELQRAQLKIGREAAKALAPMQEALAHTISYIADFIAANPGIVKAAAGAGAVLLAAGTAAAGVVKVVGLVSQLKSVVTALGGIQKVSGVAGAAGGIGVAAAAGVGLGIAGARLIGKATGNEELAQSTLLDLGKVIVKTIATVGTISEVVALKVFRGIGNAVLDGLIKLGEAIENIFPNMGRSLTTSAGEMRDRMNTSIDNVANNLGAGAVRLMEAIETFGDVPKEIEQIDVGPWSQEQLDEHDDRLRELARSEADYQHERKLALEDHQYELQMATDEYARSTALAWEDYYYDRQLAEADFQRSLADTEREYQYSRKLALEEHEYSKWEAQRDYQRGVEEAIREHEYEKSRTIEEYQYQDKLRLEAYHRERARAEADHRRSIMEAAASLDAVALLNEQRQFMLDQKQAQKDYDLETRENERQRKREEELNEREFARQQELNKFQFDRQMADTELQFARQQMLEEREHQRQLAEAERQFKIQEELAEEQFQHELERSEREFAYQQEMSERQYARQEQLERAAHERELQLNDQYAREDYERMLFWLTASDEALEAYYQGLAQDLDNFIAGAQSSASQANTRYGEQYNTAGTGPGYYSGKEPATPGKKKTQQKRGSGGSAISKRGTRGGYATGGYVAATAPALVHTGEFVLTGNTTRQLENMSGKKLSQNTLIQNFRRSQAGNFMPQLHLAINGAGVNDPVALQKMIVDQVVSRLTAMFEAYAAGQTV